MRTEKSAHNNRMVLLVATEDCFQPIEVIVDIWKESEESDFARSLIYGSLQ
jgi:hypothetical protein